MGVRGSPNNFDSRVLYDSIKCRSASAVCTHKAKKEHQVRLLLSTRQEEGHIPVRWGGFTAKCSRDGRSEHLLVVRTYLPTYLGMPAWLQNNELWRLAPGHVRKLYRQTTSLHPQELTYMCVQMMNTDVNPHVYVHNVGGADAEITPSMRYSFASDKILSVVVLSELRTGDRCPVCSPLPYSLLG